MFVVGGLMLLSAILMIVLARQRNDVAHTGRGAPQVTGSRH